MQREKLEEVLTSCVNMAVEKYEAKRFLTIITKRRCCICCCYQNLLIGKLTGFISSINVIHFQDISMHISLYVTKGQCVYIPTHNNKNILGIKPSNTDNSNVVAYSCLFAPNICRYKEI